MATINGIETEWTQLQRKLGNLPTEEAEQAPEYEHDYDKPSKYDVADGLSIAQMTRKLEDTNLEDEDEKILRELKAKRMAELRQKEQSDKTKKRFGSLQTIGSGDYVKEVSEASKLHSIFVVCHLFSPLKEECKVLDAGLQELAQRHPFVKFVRIQATLASANFPDRNCPTILIYHEGTVKAQFTGLASFGGINHTNAKSLEWVISATGAITTTQKTAPKGVQGSKSSFNFGARSVGAGRRKNSGSDDDYGASDDEDDYGSDDE